MDSSRNWDRLAGGVSCSAASASLLATFLAGYLGGSFTKGCSWRGGTDMVREDIEEVRPFVKSPAEIIPEARMDKYEKQEKRIIAILGTKKLDVTRETLSTYLKYLKNHVEIPCQLTGIEDFQWEEAYVFGFGSKREYQELKKTQPSYKDKFNLIDFIDDINDEYDGIFVNLQRLSDKKQFILPLADLKSMDKKSKNYQLLDDYSVWFVNNR
jgi:hypothetical protein